nr:hypothetical protein [Enterovibrio nigricans]
MSTMSGTRIEMIEGKKYLVVEPGVGNWDAQHTLFSLFGKALPGGSCYSVCAGGMSLAGAMVCCHGCMD